MKKVFIALPLALSMVLFFSCNKEKITEYENTIETLNSQIALLQEENNNLRKQIDNFTLTDHNFYQSGANEYCNGNYTNAIDWMNRLKVLFPTSNFISSANKIIFYSELEKDFERSDSPLQRPPNYKKRYDFYIPGAGFETLKMTDQYFYQAGVDEFINGGYKEAIDWMNKLKLKFPTSSLLGYADKIIKESNVKMEELSRNSPYNYRTTLPEVKND